MHPMQIVLALVAIVALIIIIVALIRHFRGVHGLPVPDTVNCATGAVNGHFNPGNSDTPDSYRARIISQTTDPTTIPSTTWNMWTVGTATTATSSGGLTFALTAVGRDEPSANVRVAVWCTYGTDTQIGFADFTCGSGHPAMLASRAAENTPPRVTDTASMKYSVDLSGFGPELAAGVARVCELIYRGSVTGMLWDNGEDGTDRLRVELMADRIYDADWRLTFRFRDVVINYVTSANEWRPLGVNSFHAAVQPSDAQAQFPRTVRVAPA